jgi:hypothetical protein
VKILFPFIFQAKGLVGNFTGTGALGFRSLTLVPHQTASLDVDLLSEFEVSVKNPIMQY